MKAVFKFIIGFILALKAKQYLKKNNVQVIAITGSVAKTSTKEALYQILQNKFNIYCSKKSFNTPIGLSLAVLQEEESGFSSIKEWFCILYRVFFKDKKVYEKIILEMGADKPGDIKKLIKIAPPFIGVVTHIAPVHLAKGQFKSLSEIAKEKSVLLKMLPQYGTAIINGDDSFISEMKTNAEKIVYGTGALASLRAKNINTSPKSLSFTVEFNDECQDFQIPVLGKFQLYVFLPAIAAALKIGLSLKECSEYLSNFSLPPGRMNPIEGINGSLIIDSSYNASPITMKKAIELLSDFKSENKIVALGTMNELGDNTKDAHLEIGRLSAKTANLIVAVGQEASTIKQGAVDSGFPEEKIRTFLDSEEAGYFLKDQITAKDIVLVKGSQDRVRMEKLVKIIMAYPENAPRLLCRQEKGWGE